VVGVVEQRAVDEIATIQVEQRQRSSVGGVDHRIGVDEQHRLGKLVEQPPDLVLGRLDRGELAEHANPLAAAVPHADREGDDRDDADDDDDGVSAPVHASRLGPHHHATG
jgi:hypothetical protein